MSNDFIWTDELVKEFGREFVRAFPQESSTPEGGNKRQAFFEQWKQSKMPKTERPPIGISPMWVHNQERLDELNKAISRYDRANLPIPKEWICEKESLDAYMKGKLESWRKEMMNQPLQFRSSDEPSQPKKEWEIVSVTEGFGSYVDVDKDGKVRYAHFSDCSVEDALQNRGYKIRSVRRLSDNEVFTVGDEVEYRSADASDWGDICGYGTINWFKISLVYKSRMEVEINDEHRWRDAYFPHKYIENIRHKKPQPKKERIEVTHASTGDTTMTLYFSGVIPYGKYNEIKFAVEKVFNNER